MADIDKRCPMTFREHEFNPSGRNVGIMDKCYGENCMWFSNGECAVTRLVAVLGSISSQTTA